MDGSLINLVLSPKQDTFLAFVLGFIIVHEVSYVGGSLFLATIDYFDLCPESKIQKVEKEGKEPSRAIE